MLTDFDMEPENVKDEESRVVYLTKVVTAVADIVGPLEVNPLKIMDGVEVENTLILLQSLATAAAAESNSNATAKSTIIDDVLDEQSEEEEKEEHDLSVPQFGGPAAGQAFKSADAASKSAPPPVADVSVDFTFACYVDSDSIQILKCIVHVYFYIKKCTRALSCENFWQHIWAISALRTARRGQKCAESCGRLLGRTLSSPSRTLATTSFASW